MARDWIGLFRRALKKPPRTVMRRAWSELRSAADRYSYDMRAKRFRAGRLLRATGGRSLDALWTRLLERPGPFFTQRMEASRLEALCPGQPEAILQRAERALKHDVEL